MTNQEIEAIIAKYSLVKVGDKLRGAVKSKNDEKSFFAEVTPHKEEIKKYLDDKAAAFSAQLEKRLNTFNSIPGVRELREAREQRAELRRQMNEMWETGSSILPNVNAPTPEEMSKLEEQYPEAIFALEAEWRALNTQNIELYTIWNDTYDALCNGESFETVKANHDKAMNEFDEKHMFD